MCAVQDLRLLPGLGFRDVLCPSVGLQGVAKDVESTRRSCPAVLCFPFSRTSEVYPKGLFVHIWL